MTDDTAYAWSAAFEKARDPAFGDEIVVPRSAEAALPPTMELRRSPPPFSLRRGADEVFRQTESGEHYVVRKYEDRWTVAVHERNPHDAPLAHLLRDVEVKRTLGDRLRQLVGGLGPTRGETTPAPERR